MVFQNYSEYLFLGPGLLLVCIFPPLLNSPQLTLTRNVGLFRYWTLPNIPLFLLAAPILVVMIVSGLWGAGVGSTVGIEAASFERGVIRKLAFPQIVLALLAITSYHVQIITRLSSGYMVWYWWVACQMPAGGRVAERKEGADWPKRVVRYMVVYGVVQGVLFAGFLPPA